MTQDAEGRRSGGGAALLVVVVLAVLVVGGVAIMRATRGSTDRVVLLGDSITVAFMDRGQDAPVGGHPSEVKAIAGKRVAELLPAAEEAAAGRPAAVVVNLGTNDLVQGRSAPEVLADLDRVTDVVDDQACVHVVTVNEGILAFDQPDIRTRIQGVNAGLRDLAARRGYRVIEWSALVAQHDVAGDPAHPVTSDSIHPTPAGFALLTQAYDQSVAAGCAEA